MMFVISRSNCFPKFPASSCPPSRATLSPGAENHFYSSVSEPPPSLAGGPRQHPFYYHTTTNLRLDLKNTQNILDLIILFRGCKYVDFGQKMLTIRLVTTYWTSQVEKRCIRIFFKDYLQATVSLIFSEMMVPTLFLAQHRQSPASDRLTDCILQKCSEEKSDKKTPSFIQRYST